MKGLGVLLVVLGCLGLLVTWSMDTTVETGGEQIGYGEYSRYVPKSRVHNVGLLEERRNYLILSSVAVIAGIVLYGFGALAEAQAKAKEPPAGPHCPKCNGVLEGRPELCKYCRTELRWGRGQQKPLTPEQAAIEQQAYRREQEERRRQQQLSRWRATELELQKATRRWEAKRRRAALIAGTVDGMVKVGESIDNTLKKFAGRDNKLVYRFLQVFFYGVVPIVVLAALLWMLSR